MPLPKGVRHAGNTALGIHDLFIDVMVSLGGLIAFVVGVQLIGHLVGVILLVIGVAGLLLGIKGIYETCTIWRHNTRQINKDLS
jgi:hypothetical protein